MKENSGEHTKNWDTLEMRRKKDRNTKTSNHVLIQRVKCFLSFLIACVKVKYAIKKPKIKIVCNFLRSGVYCPD